MNILLDFRPFINKIPSNGEYFCKDFFHALFRNNPSDIFYIWTTGSEHLPPQYKFDTHANVRRIHTEIEINTLYTLIHFFQYPAIDDLVETLAMKNGHMAWVGKFDAAFFSTPMPVLLEGDCLHVHITNHLQPLHTPEIFHKDHMKYQALKFYKKNWKNADINIIPSEFLAKELEKEVNEEDDETCLFISNIGVPQNISRFIPDSEPIITEDALDILELNETYQETLQHQAIYESLPSKFFYAKATLQTIQTILKAFSLFSQRFPEDNIQIIIEEPFPDAFKYTHFLQRSEAVRIIPPEHREKRILLYSKCLFFIDANEYDTEGKYTLEAMKCGSPIISSTYGALPEICPSENFFFDPLSYSELFKAMKSAYRSTNETIAHISRKNTAIANQHKYCWDDITTAIMNKIKDTIEEREMSI